MDTMTVFAWAVIITAPALTAAVIAQAILQWQANRLRRQEHHLLEAMRNWSLEGEPVGTPNKRNEGVYFVQGASGGPIKIGYSTDVAKRIGDLQTGSPLPLCLLAVADGGLDYETYLHRAFEDERTHGEWFAPTPRLLQLIQEIAND